jgi:hypothetical protein
MHKLFVNVAECWLDMGVGVCCLVPDAWCLWFGLEWLLASFQWPNLTRLADKAFKIFMTYKFIMRA